MTGEVDLGIDELSDFRTIGTGGFSTVFSAWDEGFRRRVAVKVLQSLDDAGRRRFDRERGIMGQLSSHPNVIMPFRAGYTPTGAPYLVMELVEGGSLQDQVDQRGSIPWAEAVDYIIPTAAALGHAHKQQILHRDVKPGNVLLAGRVPKLTDFGIAAIRESTASQVAYTLSHCPPETFAAGYDARDERSDLYSLASTLYTLLVGRAPYDIEDPDSQQAYMFRIIGHPAPAVPEHLGPEALRSFLASALAKDPAARPQAADDFGEQLERIRSGANWSGSAVPSGPWSGQVTEVSTTSDPGEHGSADNLASAQASFGSSALDPRWPAPMVGDADTSGRAGTIGTDQPATIATDEHDALVGAPGPRRRSGILALAALAVVVAALAAGGWWFLSRAPADPTPEVAWRFDTNSSLASKPAVADGTLVIGAHVTNTVHGIDTDSGVERWALETGGPVDANPTIVDGVVYIGSDDGSMYAIALDDGGVIWQQDLGSRVRAGALVIDDLVVAATEQGEVFGLDRREGEPLWSVALENTTFNATPVTAAREGATVIVIGGTDGGLYLLDPGTGDLLDRIGLNGGVWFSSPLVLDRSGGEGQELWIGTSEESRGFLNRVELDTGRVQTFETSGGVGTDPAVTADGFIIAGNDIGELFAVDRISLGEVWREGYADQTQIKGSPVVVGDEVIFGTHGKELIAVDAADGSERWRFEGEQIFGLSAPVVVGDRLFVGNDSGAVYRFDL